MKGTGAQYELQVHEFEPFYEGDSRVLLLGSFPSVKSREQQFYYGHPQNRFWRVLAALTKEQFPEQLEQKKSLLRRHHIALWDVIESCEIRGSSDSSIRNVLPTQLERIWQNAPIRMIGINGKTAGRLFETYQK